VHLVGFIIRIHDACSPDCQRRNINNYFRYFFFIWQCH